MTTAIAASAVKPLGHRPLLKLKAFRELGTKETPIQAEPPKPKPKAVAVAPAPQQVRKPQPIKAAPPPRAVARPSGVYPTAVIGKNVVLEHGVEVREGAQLGDNVTVEFGSIIAPGARVPAGTRVPWKMMFLATGDMYGI